MKKLLFPLKTGSSLCGAISKEIGFLSVSFFVLFFLGISEVRALEVTENSSGFQAVQDPTNAIQPAEDVIYGERIRINSALSVARSSYFYEGIHLGSADGTGGVIFANGTIINRSPNDTPVTFGDDVRIDGEIWRGPARGTSDGQPLKFSDTLTPTITNTNDVGDSSHYWRNAYFSGDVTVGNILGSGVIHPGNLSVASAATSGQVLAINSDGDFEWTTIGTSGGSVTVGDITSVIAGTGLSGGGTSGDVTLSLGSTYESGEAYDDRFVNVTGDTMTGPLIVTGSAINTNSMLSVTNTGVNGRGIVVESSGSGATAVRGYATDTAASANFGGDFRAAGTGGIGVTALSSGDSGYGVHGTATGSSGIGVRGVASNSATTAVQGYSTAVSGRGVHGIATGATHSYGVYGEGNIRGVFGESTTGTGVRGASTSGRGVYGESTSYTGVYGTTDGSNDYGVHGVADGGTNARGVFGESSSGRGVYGESDTGYAVRGNVTTSGYSGYFTGGDFRVNLDSGGLFILESGHSIWPVYDAGDDDTTPDVSLGDIVILGANTGATVITDLDNPSSGQIVRLVGDTDVAGDASTIADAAPFYLSVAWTATANSTLTLLLRETNRFIELSRSTN